MPQLNYIDLSAGPLFRSHRHDSGEEAAIIFTFAPLQAVEKKTPKLHAKYVPQKTVPVGSNDERWPRKRGMVVTINRIPAPILGVMTGSPSACEHSAPFINQFSHIPSPPVLKLTLFVASNYLHTKLIFTVRARVTSTLLNKTVRRGVSFERPTGVASRTTRKLYQSAIKPGALNCNPHGHTCIAKLSGPNGRVPVVAG